MSEASREGNTTQFGAIGAVGAEPDEFSRASLTPSDQEAVEALPPASALLIVQRGPNMGARFLLDAPRTTAGRHPSSDIFLDDVTAPASTPSSSPRTAGSWSATSARSTAPT